MTSIIKVNTIQDAGGNALLTSNGSGTLTTNNIGGQNTPAFHVEKTDSHQSVAHNTLTLVTFNNEELDTNSAFASNIFTVPSGEGGTYFVYATIYCGNTDDYNYLTIRKNGSSTKVLNHTLYESSSADQTITISGSVTLSATDYLGVYYQQSSGGAVNVEKHADGNTTYFGGYKIIT